MFTGGTYRRLCVLLKDSSHDLGMAADDGPLRAMRELTAGIIFTGSVQLTNAARLFAEDEAELTFAAQRLSDHFADPRWDHRDRAAGILRHHVREIEDTSLIPIGGTELAKPYARKMEYQNIVRDASRPGLCPLMLRPYSTQQPHFLSENDQWQRDLWTLRQATDGKGIWLMDRGGDRPEVLKILPRGDVWQVEHPPRLDLLVPTYTYGNDERWMLLTCGLIAGPAPRQGPAQVRHD